MDSNFLLSDIAFALGDLPQNVTASFESPSNTVSSDGEIGSAYTVHSTALVNFIQLTTYENMQVFADKQNSEYSLLTTDIPTLNESWRVTVGSISYGIKTVSRNSTSNYMNLICAVYI